MVGSAKPFKPRVFDSIEGGRDRTRLRAGETLVRMGLMPKDAKLRLHNFVPCLFELSDIFLESTQSQKIVFKFGPASNASFQDSFGFWKQKKCSGAR